MPQMAPISWLTLFIMFSLIFILFNILNYFCFFSKTSSKNKNLTKNPLILNWKW